MVLSVSPFLITYHVGRFGAGAVATTTAGVPLTEEFGVIPDTFKMASQNDDDVTL